MIWRELSISRENQRPVIVSMSDLAASGGYYIALGGDAIVAQPGTLTGSIGVYTGKFVITGIARQTGREHRERRATASTRRSIRRIAGSRPRSAPRSRSRCSWSTTSSSSAPPRRGT